MSESVDLIAKEFTKLRNEFADHLVKERPNNANRIIAIVRQYGRKWDKLSDEHPDWHLRKGGFNKAIKEDLKKWDFSLFPDFERAFKSALYFL